MTDGIIQKVFNDKITNSRNIENDFRISRMEFRIRHRLVADTLEQVKQELIEKIKQNSSYLTYYECEALSLKQLIGDNQE